MQLFSNADTIQDESKRTGNRSDNHGWETHLWLSDAVVPFSDCPTMLANLGNNGRSSASKVPESSRRQLNEVKSLI